MITRLVLLLSFFWIGLCIGEAKAEDTGQFERFKLNEEQKAWFDSDKKIRSCCKLADGVPTYYERRNDGHIYVPPKLINYNSEEETWNKGPTYWDVVDTAKDPKWKDHSNWVMVPDSQILKRKNPIGVAIVWWTNGTPATVRCFIGESED